MKKILYVGLLFWMSCSDKGDVLPPAPAPPGLAIQTFSANRTTVFYDGDTHYDSIVTVTWATTGATSVMVQGVSVAPQGSMNVVVKTRAIAPIKIVATSASASIEKSIPITVTMTPEVSKLVGGWTMTKLEAQEIGTTLWIPFTIDACRNDDVEIFTPYRGSSFTRGEIKCLPDETQSGSVTPLSWRLLTVDGALRFGWFAMSFKVLVLSDTTLQIEMVSNGAKIRRTYTKKFN